MPRTKQPLTVPTAAHDGDPAAHSQLELFSLVDGDTKTNKRYSNTVALYDSLPKYSWEQRDVTEVSDQARIRTIKIGGDEYKVEVRPALITRNGKNVMVYPGIREELVEDALRKLVVEGQGVAHQGEIGVRFTMYQLQKELADNGRTYSRTELQEALEVCNGTNLRVTGHEGKTIVSSPIFPHMMLTTREEYLDTPTDTKCYVRFNPLVTDSIINLKFRRYDYTTGISMKHSLARWIFKRMSHYWTQASATHPYSYSLVSYLQSSPRGLTKDMSENRRAMNRALDALKMHNVVSHYEMEQIKDGRRLIDIQYRVFPTDQYVSEAISHNQHNKTIHEQHLKSLRTQLQKKKPTLKGG